MKKYIVSKTNNANFVLAEYSIEDVCGTGLDAEASARELTMDSGVNHFVFEVDLNLTHSVRSVTSVEVKRIVTPK